MAGAELRFSLVVPIYNEEENVQNLLAEVEQVLLPHGPFEAILVDDGSRDRSLERMREWKRERAASWLRIVTLERNCGQSAAVMAGVEQARAPIVTTMDGDMQNDPRDLPAMVARVQAGECDAVVGVRRKRQDSWTRRMSSRIGNGARNWLTGDRVTDAACGIKAIRREFWLRAPKFQGMHRFMATLVKYLGGVVVEVDVHHRPRAAGTAKYGIGNRIWKGLRDCFAMRWLRTRMLMHRVKEEF
ncbi:MAG: glycosyltransferase family 2 protein [Planctomycetes bacterium]|jgi:dolichol-phosphate mannosyltransferase|nr:glycosyltransferase family 2 protein [Planctomycetota bacterium]